MGTKLAKMIANVADDDLHGGEREAAAIAGRIQQEHGTIVSWETVLRHLPKARKYRD